MKKWIMLRFAFEMGWRYSLFRLWYELQRILGILKWRFPKNQTCKVQASLAAWRQTEIGISIKDFLPDETRCTHALKQRVDHILKNKFQYFHHTIYEVKDWHTNPKTGFQYDPTLHWSEIPDFCKQAGDIKYVWEKSRFLFLQDLIWYDFLTGSDHSKEAFDLMIDWIDENPVNCGPNWKCGQEIALRVINWILALTHYRESEYLDKAIFRKIISSIYLQIRRVERNLSFSLYAVRNNHALTECLGLYITAVIFPFLGEQNRWREKGKQLFEREIAYQVREDGTYIQHSMNYHRVAVQLLSLAFLVGKLVDEQWSPTIIDRARKSLDFLSACQDPVSGWLPNYGNNDGALFFRLSDAHFRDYRPQLALLSRILKYKPPEIQEGICAFEIGGYYVVRERNVLTMIRCASYDTRPFQADNMHLDIWVNGENIIRDAGTYSYFEETAKYFESTQAHNTASLGGLDQMQRGPRFIWTNRVINAGCELFEAENSFVFQGWFDGYKYLGKGIRHHRRVQKIKGRLCWIVEDRFQQALPHLPLHQHWHVSKGFDRGFEIAAFDRDNAKLSPHYEAACYAETYGAIEETNALVFKTEQPYILTTINAIL